MVDYNCFIGPWPFRKLYKNTFDDLKEIHKKHNIEYGYIASLSSVFYNDPYEGDWELHEVIKGSGYKHVLSVNPTLPGFIDDILNGVKEFDIKGVRIYPGYHSYTLQDRCVDTLCEVLKDLNLPLFVSNRLEDIRLSYIYIPRTLSLDEIRSFIDSHHDNRIYMLTLFVGELFTLKESINNHNNLCFDTSGLKDQLFADEKLLDVFSKEKIVYGSMYPLYCFSSTYQLYDRILNRR